MLSRCRLLASLGLLPLFLLTLHAQSSSAPAPTNTSWLDPYREPAARLVGEALSGRFAWERLALMTDTFGNRLSGSQSLEDTIQWAAEEMKKDGLENVH